MPAMRPSTKEIEKKAPAPTTDANTTDTGIIPDKKKKCTKKSGGKKQKKGKKAKAKGLQLSAETRTVFGKLYAEQILLNADVDKKLGLPELTPVCSPDITEWTDEMIEARHDEYLAGVSQHWQRFAERVRGWKPNASGKMWDVIAILHNRDVKTDADDVFAASFKKPHVHVMMYQRDGGMHAVKLSTLLNGLGVGIRKQDASLMANRAFTAIDKDKHGQYRLQGCALYLTHEDASAIHANKTVYDFSELVSNMGEEDLRALRSGTAQESGMDDTAYFLQHMADEARKAAREGLDFDEWWLMKSMSFRVENSRLYTELQREYLSEQAAVAEALPDIARCVMYVWGDADTGKSYATRTYFRQLYGPQPDRVIEVSGQGSGAFDKVTLRTGAIIFDDTQKGEGLTANMLKLCDDGKPVVHKRYKGNVAFVGDYTVIVSNYPPKEWLRRLGDKYWDEEDERPNEAGEALMTRLTKVYVHEEGNDIVVDAPTYSARGTDETRRKKKELADKYVKYLRESCQYYAAHGHKPHKVSPVIRPVNTTGGSCLETVRNAEKEHEEEMKKYNEWLESDDAKKSLDFVIPDDLGY